MTFEEFQKADVLQAYTDWNTMALYKAAEIIPSEYHEFFPDTCPECGSDIIIKVNLKLSMCCNRKCRCKAGYNIAELLTRYGVKGLGAKSCQKVYDAMVRLNEKNIAAGEKPILVSDSPFATLLVPWDEYPMSLRETVLGSDFALASVAIREQKVTFAEMIGNLGIKELGVSKAKTLFGDVNTVEEFTSKINEAGGLIKFCESRGVHSRVVMTDLLWAFDDLATASVLFAPSIRNVGLKTIRLCMTGNIRRDGYAITKKKYISDLNALCVDSEGVQLFDFTLTSGALTDPFILYSSESRSDKFLKGLQRGIIKDEFGMHSVLVTADEFYETIKEVMQKWNQILQSGEVINPMDLMRDCWTQKSLMNMDSGQVMRSGTSQQSTEIQAF